MTFVKKVDACVAYEEEKVFNGINIFVRLIEIEPCYPFRTNQYMLFERVVDNVQEEFLHDAVSIVTEYESTDAIRLTIKKFDALVRKFKVKSKESLPF